MEDTMKTTNNIPEIVLKKVAEIKAESEAKRIVFISENIVEERGSYSWSYAMVFRLGSRYLSVNVRKNGEAVSREINKPTT